MVSNFVLSLIANGRLADGFVRINRTPDSVLPDEVPGY
tara:strand:- start:771 stop:884 length:114 start_codon:yes stop_codon:yes gene_type:complete